MLGVGMLGFGRGRADVGPHLGTSPMTQDHPATTEVTLLARFRHDPTDQAADSRDHLDLITPLARKPSSLSWIFSRILGVMLGDGIESGREPVPILRGRARGQGENPLLS